MWQSQSRSWGCLSCQHHSRVVAERAPFLDGEKFNRGEFHGTPIPDQLLTRLHLPHLPHRRFFLFPFKIIMPLMSTFMAAKQEHVVILWELCLKKGGANPSSSGT